jgi:translation initiation factor eIF-2B subunit delta
MAAGATPKAGLSEGDSTSTRKTAKDMTKAERRALQEKQRADKAASKAQQQAGQSSKAKQPTSAPPPILKAPLAPSSNMSDSGLPGPMSLFLHLEPPRSSKQLAGSKGYVHPSVLRLALQIADMKIVGANARCIAMLEAFKDVSSFELGPKNHCH